MPLKAPPDTAISSPPLPEWPVPRLLPVLLPHPPKYRMDDLKDKPGVLASTVNYVPTSPPDYKVDDSVRANQQKLIEARWLSVPDRLRPLIVGTSSAYGGEWTKVNADVDKRHQSMLTAFVRSKSWLQQWIRSTITWHNLQIMVDNLDLELQRLCFEPDFEETAQRREDRNKLIAEYKAVLRVTIAHVNDQKTRIIAEAVTAANNSVGKKREQLQHVVSYNKQFEAPFNTTNPRYASLDLVPANHRGFFFMTYTDRYRFFMSKVTKDVFLSAYWPFHILAHKENWVNDETRRTLCINLVKVCILVANCIVHLEMIRYAISTHHDRRVRNGFTPPSQATVCYQALGRCVLKEKHGSHNDLFVKIPSEKSSTGKKRNTDEQKNQPKKKGRVDVQSGDSSVEIFREHGPSIGD
ncbi:hypothetical protein K491DRAFT_676517 [Lophiostoma macrostomum CBS 122681]|uniref:Uncharacterized protein n=1 Tax=Lophiostoma macrostomum CBS 122681 TaxID=1314788 RepID=A0A6A6TFQ5_9PLEO|nr:hypothetical protein K491DRAFT_676517 [Lophiostoma macrostomum CBS 122681]